MRSDVSPIWAIVESCPRNRACLEIPKAGKYWLLETENLQQQKRLSRPQVCVENSTAASPISDSNLDELHDEAASFAALSDLLRRCGKAKALSAGRRVHARISSYGYDCNTFLANCLIQMYGNCNSVQDARIAFDKLHVPNVYSWNILFQVYAQNRSLDDAISIFSRMPERDVVSWNGVIAACARNGRFKEALELFCQMRSEGIEPNRITFLSVLDTCSDMASLEEGQKIHAIIRDSPYERDEVVRNALVNMYAKCESLERARIMFRSIPRQNVNSWSAMISAYARNGQAKDAMTLFYEMLLEGIKPDGITFISVLTACGNLGALAEGQKIHAAIVDSGYEQDINVGNALVSMYAKCGSLNDAKIVFDQISQPDVVSWTAMIAACAQNGYGRQALDLFYQMQLEGTKPNHVTIVCALDACSSLAALEEGQNIHAGIADSGYAENLYVGNALVNMYGKSGNLDEARSIFSRMSQRNVASWNAMIAVSAQNGNLDEALSLFGRMPQRDVVSWNAMIAAFAQTGRCKEAVDLFHQMQLEAINPNKITFVTLLDAFTSLRALEEGQEVHSAVIYNGHDQDAILGNALVHMYAKCGRLECAKFVFDRIHHPDVVSWSSMIAAYVQNGHGKEAIDLFGLMQHEDVTPDKITFSCLLTACANLAALEKGQEIHAAIVALNFEGDVAVGNALLSMYGKCGSIYNVRTVFGKMNQRDIVSWTAAIAGCAQCGEGKEALELFSLMQIEGVKPDEVTFISVLSACCHTGQVDDGKRYFASMVREHNLIHMADHYICMVDLLGRAGHLDEAEDLINSMPFENNYLAWLSLLGACRIHSDMKRGVLAALRCFQLDAKNDAPFALLSNVFAAAGKWDGAVEVTEIMKNTSGKQWFEGCFTEVDKMVAEWNFV